MSDLDPTQQGGQELQPAHAGRNAAMAEIAKRAHEEVAPDLKAFDEATGEIAQDAPQEAVQERQAEQEQAEPEQQDDAAAPAHQAETTKPKMVQIVVHGQTLEVPEDRIIEAGRRTLQKESAADKLLQQAAEKERQAEAMLRQAHQRLSGQQPDADQRQAPSSDAPPFDPNQLVTAVSGVVSQNLRLERAREVFDSEFPEIASDPVLLGIAARLEQDRLDHAAAVGEPLGDPVLAYRKHGETVRKWLQERTGNKPAVPQDKQERKRTITSVQAANARAPAPQEKKPLTTSEIIEQQRLARRGRQIQPNARRP